MILLMILINVITFAVKRMAKVSFEYEIWCAEIYMKDFPRTYKK